MNTILGIANGVLQYQRGKQTGIYGLVGIVVALIIVFQWNHIVPILDALGIIDFLDKYGLIYEGEGYLTGYVLFKLAFKASLLFVAALAILMVISIIFSMVFSSNIGIKIGVTGFMLIAFPFLVCYFLYDAITTPKAIKEERYRQARERNKPVIEVLKESFEIIDKATARRHLNRLPTTGDYHFLLAVTKNEEIYAVLPRARYRYENPVVKLKVEKYDERTHKASFGEYQPKQFKVTYDHRDYNETLQFDILKCKLNIEDDEVVYLLKPEHDDFNHLFKWITNSQGFKTYMNDQIENYFKRKQNLLDSISKADTKEEFDSYVAVIKEMDASNEDIVKIMWDSQSVEI